MKIIKEGILPPPKEPEKPKTYTKECPNCHTIYEFTKDEGKVGLSNEIAFDLYLICPFCGSENVKTLKYYE